MKKKSDSLTFHLSSMTMERSCLLMKGKRQALDDRTKKEECRFTRGRKESKKMRNDIILCRQIIYY